MNMGQYTETSLERFDTDVIQASHENIVLLDLWAEWCPPCITIAPILEQVVEEYEGEVLLVKIEVDDGDNMKIAGQYQVRGFPTILLFQNGEEKARFSGAKPASFIKDFIEDNTD
ncbi:MAG: thioredoxin fold domain-containing protein [Gammaproteobacteria bacterium]|nr:thioredoxin fold domain-containing protein [Gammaproteobacteria bacterium]